MLFSILTISFFKSEKTESVRRSIFRRYFRLVWPVFIVNSCVYFTANTFWNNDWNDYRYSSLGGGVTFGSEFFYPNFSIQSQIDLSMVNNAFYMGDYNWDDGDDPYPAGRPRCRNGRTGRNPRHCFPAPRRPAPRHDDGGFPVQAQPLPQNQAPALGICITHSSYCCCPAKSPAHDQQRWQ